LTGSSSDAGLHVAVIVSRFLAALALSGCALWPLAGHAQTDEIQIYDASIAELGKVDFTLHSNFTPVGRTQADFPGGIVPDHSDNGAFEFGYGFRDWWELGLYLPVYTIRNDGNLEFDGFKLRSLWVTPDARKREFFYGLNVELSYNMPQWDTSRTSLEFRPIIGWHEGKWDFIVNPILDSQFHGIGQTHFAPGTRVAYNASDRWAFAVETYSDLGEISNGDPWEQQFQTVYAVTDLTTSKDTSFEFGVGRGLTSGSDKWNLKFIFNQTL
jgi:hypothetical protein